MNKTFISAIIIVFSPFLHANVTGRVINTLDTENRAQFVIYLREGKNIEQIKIDHNKVITMAQKDKEFSPKIAAAHINNSINFKNLDNIYHNVFSLDPNNKFDLGTFKGDEKYEDDLSEKLKHQKKSLQKFKTPGKVNIFCNIHPEMMGVLYLFDHSYFTMTNYLGEFSLPLNIDGSYTLVIDSPSFSEPEIYKFQHVENEKKELKIYVEVNKKDYFVDHTKKNGKEYPMTDLLDDDLY